MEQTQGEQIERDGQGREVVVFDLNGTELFRYPLPIVSYVHLLRWTDKQGK
jgi:hypothetical protein